jgi:hypothetical protein
LRRHKKRRRFFDRAGIKKRGRFFDCGVMKNAVDFSISQSVAPAKG